MIQRNAIIQKSIMVYCHLPVKALREIQRVEAMNVLYLYIHKMH